MNLRVKPKVALVMMLVIGGLFIYIGSMFPFSSQTNTDTEARRCSPAEQNRLQASFDQALRRRLASPSTQKQALLNVLKQHVELSDCTKVVDQIVILAKLLVSYDTSFVEKEDITFALLHGLENNTAVYQLTELQKHNAINLAELYLQFMKDGDLAGNPNQLGRYKDLTLMLATAMEQAGQPHEAQIWKIENQKYAPKTSSP